MLEGSVLRGYAQTPNVPAGDSVTIHVSSEVGDYEAVLVRLINGDPNPAGPGFKEEEIRSLGTFKGRKQETYPGSFIRVSPSRPLVIGEGFTFHAFIRPTRPRGGEQVIASQLEQGKGGWELALKDGRLTFAVSDGEGQTDTVVSDKLLFDYVWYSVAACVDPAARAITLRQSSVINSFNSRFGPVVPIDAVSEVHGALSVAPGPIANNIVFGAALCGGDGNSERCYDGKIDAPVILEAALPAESIEKLKMDHDVGGGKVFGRWDFAWGISREGISTDHVHDISGNGHHGVCVNQPIRACTGWNWNGKFDCYMLAPEEYGAIWFHSDAIEDCKWDADFKVDIPPDAKSGVYSVRLRGGGYEEYITFFVTPAKDAARSPIAVIIPTFTYMSYSNFYPLQHWAQDDSGFDGQEANNGGVSVATTRDFEIAGGAPPYGVSNYERHADGSGAIFATWRRPQLMLKPKHFTSWNFQGDMCLIDWLETTGFEYDIITDHDVHAEGAELLSKYKAVVTCCHPEYTTTAYNDAWEQFLVQGGRGMYLGGNGMYWVTAQPLGKPWLIEVRRGETGDGAWQSEPGEQYTSSTGEHGGLWRMRGRAGYKIWGTSYVAHALEQGGFYVQLPDSTDSRMRWIFEGVGPDEEIGAFGHYYKGAASVELDRYDLRHGTPPHTMLLASSVEHGPNATIVPEEMGTTHPFINGIEHPKVRADMTYFTTPLGGAMFSPSSIGWCHSLNWNGYKNNVARITENVLRRFSSEEPLPEIV
ncbi:N,N-dimethylformamidase beta subunit family domain-containing protein [Sinorhizobium meliloti]|uniref:N,N-dimethylformamidase beta subunit family domain-containing protein n=1 Tax=Rhizobium meliloti TaxID=382 RepID=UPI000373D4C5|nr:N,N-dimethylformamidase beta subunit family domain-containing protein [Sinorhizobium meliloti]